ncbi:hypothetical protein KI688_012312 [Linnemannia hyalina]|uniref:HCP-like protein n=1 Tax=Linnemannia hyalina TaxID=64524 RepID=A0A9P7XX53_9FUNG|nr:hypothetical protein KI688_012312 [Linnemannia hyalina]
MDHNDPHEEEPLQTVRPVHKNNLFPTLYAPVAHVVINSDPSNGKKIILWEDILQAFKDASHPRHGTKILPFLKSCDFKCLEPLRFNAVPNDIIDIVVDGQFTSTDPPPVQSTFDEIASQASQYPKYDPLDSLRPPNALRDPRTLSSSSTYSYEIPNYRTMPTPSFWNQMQAPTQLTQHTRVPYHQPRATPSHPPASRPPASRPPTSRPAPTPKPRPRMDAKEAFRRIILHIDLVALEEKGEGTPEEFTKALECYLKEVCRGHGHAHLSVGELFAQGKDVVLDESRAFEWYLKAAYQGNAVAQRKISRLIFNQPNRSAAAPEAILGSSGKDSSTDSNAMSCAETYMEAQSTPAEICVETPLARQETAVETQDPTVMTQEESPNDTSATTQDTTDETLIDTSTETDTKWEQSSQMSDDDFIDMLPVHPDQADDEDVATPTPSTCTPTTSAPTVIPPKASAPVARAPQSYGLDECDLPTPAQNPVKNENPSPPQLNTNSFEQTLANAEYGDTEAQVRLGLMYMQADDRGQYEHAVRWFFKAALRGDSEGQRHVGEMFMKGLGVPQDYKAAMYWLNEAAEQGNGNAQFLIGNLYGAGQGVPKNYFLARAWYLRAANLGHVEAQNMMGFQHEMGLEMPSNLGLALEWYVKAARQGHVGAKESAAKLRKDEQLKSKRSFRGALRKIFS